MRVNTRLPLAGARHEAYAFPAGCLTHGGWRARGRVVLYRVTGRLVDVSKHPAAARGGKA
jgi:hypothetical protein